MVTNEIRIKNQAPLDAAKPPKRDSLEKLAVSVLRNTDYKVIKNPESYRSLYKRRISKENNDFDLQPRITDFGIFDVSSIRPPEIVDKRLVFYARNSHNLPYKVTCDLKDRKTCYELLPYESACPEKMQTK